MAHDVSVISDEEDELAPDWPHDMPHTASISLSHTHETLDLSGVNSPVIELTVIGASRTQMVTTPPSGTVKLSPEVRRLHIHMTGKRQGQISLVGTSHIVHVLVTGSPRSASRLVLDAPSVRHIALKQTRVELDGPTQKSHRHISSMKLDDASVAVRNRHINDLLITGRCEVELNHTQVENLMAPTETHVSLATISCEIGLVKMAEDAEGTGSVSPTLVLESPNGDKSVKFDRMQNISVAVAARVTLSVRRVEAAVLQGNGQIRVEELARNVRAKNGIVISAGRGAQLIGVSGEVTLRQVADSRITSGGEGDSSLVVTTLSDDFDVSGLSITGVEFPVSLEGLRLISIITSEAGHVVPVIPSKLRGFANTTVDESADSSRELELAANYAELLSDLADSRGAPSSVRSELAWFRYRMRNLTAPQRWERRLLSGYELLGYGEKFSAPAKLYLAVAAVAAGLCLIGRPMDVSWDGALVVGHSYLDWLMTPLHLLKLGGGTEREFELPRYLDQVFRALVAAPFVTAVLTVRKFVKR